jgi:hypothetical protein
MDTDLYFFNLLEGCDLIIVCGLYKTGTSLVANHIENQMGYNNPAKQSNPSERGYSRNGNRYFTNECKRLREINKDIIASGKPNSQNIKDYIKSIEFPSVIKDPLFCYTLKYWLNEIDKLNLKHLIIFTTRDQKETMTSWDASPYTKNLLLSQRFETLCTSFNQQLAYCKKNNSPHYRIRFEDIDNHFTHLL